LKRRSQARRRRKAHALPADLRENGFHDFTSGQ
jgi:hypothetical protein